MTPTEHHLLESEMFDFVSGLTDADQVLLETVLGECARKAHNTALTQAQEKLGAITWSTAVCKRIHDDLEGLKK